MSATEGSAHYEGLLRVEPGGPPPVPPTILENDPFPNGQPSLRKRASRALSLFLFAFCIGVAATLAWRSYGDVARQMIANSYPLLGWLAPATPSFDQQQRSAMSLDLDGVRQGIDRITAGQAHITRSLDQIAATIAAGQEQITRSIDRIAASQEQMTRSTGQTITGIVTAQEQSAPNIDQTATSTAQAPSAKTSAITVESQARASVRPTVRLEIKPAEAGPPQTSSDRGKQLSAASAHDVSCFPSASAVLQNHPGGWPTWTLRAPGHAGTMCWYASARPRASTHRREPMPGEKETVGTAEKAVSTQPASHTRAPE